MDMAYSRPNLVIAVLASCGLVVSLMQTLVVPLVPQFPHLLNAPISSVAWLLTATLLAGAVSAPVLGRLGDLYGKRRMMLVAVGLMTIGSVIGAAAPGVEVLIVARVLQGVALGAVPLGISMMRELLPPERVAGGVALMSTSLGIGGAVGLPLAGAVAQVASWRWLFAGVAVIGAVQVVLLLRVVTESRSRAAGRFDLPGALGLTAGIVALLLAISQGSDWGWGSPAVLGLVAGAVVVLVVWGRMELRATSPLVDLRVSARPTVLWTNIGSVLIGFSMFASLLVAAQVLQAPVATRYGFGLSLVVAGLALLPSGAAMAVFAPAAARLSGRFGARPTLVGGALVLVVGNLVIAALPDQLWLIVVAAVVTGIGTALATSAIPLLIMGAVPATDTAAANSLNSLMRSLGSSSCSAVAGALTSGLTAVVAGVVLPSATAYSVMFLAAAGAGLVAAVIAALTPSASTPARDLVPAS